MSEEIKKEPLGLGEILNSFHEFTPSCYTPERLEEHLLGANNALCTLREEIMPDFKNDALALMSEYGYDTVQIIEHIFHSLEVWSDVHLKYLQDEADWAEAQILNKMECHEASTHFEDYMNPPQEQSGTRHETHANIVYADTDSVIDGRDKTLCMYDVYEKAMGFKRPVLHCDKDGNTWINSQE